MVSTCESLAPSTVLSACPEDDDGNQAAQAQLLVQEFTQSIVKGRKLSVVSTNGTVECMVSLDRDLTTLFVRRSSRQGAKRRGIPLKQITRICVGNDAADARLKLDDCCSTIHCDSGEAVAFRFNDLEERDTFVLCVTMFMERAK